MAATPRGGAITRDGCPVDVYRQLGDHGEAEFISGVIKPESLVLDLGAGTGRIADALVGLGHDVVALDNSPEMLAGVQQAETVLADIENYRGNGPFDAVVLASHLINTPDVRLRHAFLRTVAENLSSNGIAFIEWHRPEWFDQLTPGRVYTGTIDAVVSSLEVTSRVGDRLEASVTYVLGDQTWTQKFAAQRLTAAELEHNLRVAQLKLVGENPFRGRWVLASSIEIHA